MVSLVIRLRHRQEAVPRMGERVRRRAFRLDVNRDRSQSALPEPLNPGGAQRFVALGQTMRFTMGRE